MRVATVTLRFGRPALGPSRCSRVVSHWSCGSSQRRLQNKDVVGLQRVRGGPALSQDLQQVRWASDGARRDAEGGASSSGLDSGAEPSAVKSDTAEANDVDNTRDEESRESSASGSNDGGEEAPEEEPPAGPRVLWTAPNLNKEFDATETSLNAAGFMTGGGLGLGLLGVAPFTPPNPFMVGLLLATVQVRLAHVWLTRQMRAQARRHVTEVVAETNDKGMLLIVTCDGGLVRKLQLIEGDEKKPSMADIVSKGNTFMCFDTARGKSDLPAVLEDVIESKTLVIGSEELSITPFADESQEEAEKVVQRLSDLTPEHLKAIGGKGADASPSAALAQIVRSSQIPAAFILLGGFVICIGGRQAAGAPSP